ncbi:AAA family ATPase [Elizabethkingia argentiflava]|uniref:Shikimate kinase n=1 Tax=Elizabethkingia argenteiflava TaxID=2681556 RepID=A0A845PT94_9FLAO|nr:shikimate kinase [Elizabethkingia argenteiflava]NAW50146.1 AAA family ATPase [Elizabethkingia argenteiflava]
MTISLLGYMGSGKSHISNILTKKTNFKLIDLDTEISLQVGKDIPSIFKEMGELRFRRIERDILKQILSLDENMILSLGGGTPAYYNNMDLINRHSKSFYLRASIPTLIARLSKHKDKRPLIANIKQEDLPEFIAKHLFERNVYYHMAEFTIDTDGKDPETIAEEIIPHLQLPH